jgi:hypothetical protein
MIFSLTEKSGHFQVRVFERDHKPQGGGGTPRVTGREGLTEVRICRPQSETPSGKNFSIP